MRVPLIPRLFVLFSLTSLLLILVAHRGQPISYSLVDSSRLRQVIEGFGNLIETICQWLGLSVEENDHAVYSKGWWRFPSPFIGTVADSSIFVEPSNSIHPSRPAAFSPPIVSPAGFSGLLIPIEYISPSTTDALGCPPNVSSALVKPVLPHNWISLTTRGGCDFSTKVLYSQQLGAKAIVVGGKSGSSSTLVTMYSFGSEADKVDIHAVFTSGKSRVDLERLIVEEGEILTVTDILGSRDVKGLRVTLSQDQTWSWPLLDLVLLLLFLPSVLTFITLLIHRWRIARQRKAQRAPQELVDRLKVVIWGEDLEKGSTCSSNSETASPTEETPLLRRYISERTPWKFFISNHSQAVETEAESGPSTLPISPPTTPRLGDTKKKIRSSRRGRHKFPLPISCAICLDEFQPGERVRVLPCGHGFHVEEVDHWLLSVRRICPTCRTSISTPESSPERGSNPIPVPFSRDEERQPTASTSTSPQSFGSASEEH